MKSGKFNGVLSETSPRFDDWQKVFKSNTVPLQSPFPVLANVPGKEAVPVYLLDLEKIDGPTAMRLSDYLTERFGTPPGNVSEILRREGLPILADDVIVYSDSAIYI